MTVLVADASALLEYVLRTGPIAELETLIRDPEADVHVPAFCDVELASGLRRAMLHEGMTDLRALEAAADYLDLPLTRHGHQTLLARLLELRYNFTAYDATYVALAEMLGATLVTTDDGLKRAVRTHTKLSVVP